MKKLTLTLQCECPKCHTAYEALEIKARTRNKFKLICEQCGFYWWEVKEPDES